MGTKDEVGNGKLMGKDLIEEEVDWDSPCGICEALHKAFLGISPGNSLSLLRHAFPNWLSWFKQRKGS